MEAFYTSGLAGLRNSTISWSGIGVALVSAISYQFDRTDTDYGALSGAVLGTGILESPTDEAGACGFDPTIIVAAPSNRLAHALVFYSLASDLLIAYTDTCIGIPGAPVGDEITLVCPHGPERLFNYNTATFGEWEGLRGIFPGPGDAEPCRGAISRYAAY